ncbi:type II secretion system protein GspM [Sphingomicrobium sediminis]|uniref:Type II secretion system protein M n=1 Tax=Sphingomicrobium sediminis TaxID=2950949 RepID=A0A9X2EHM4_9SPHN|nr:type II secretion system protein GspM [Sphingomicrobium sediminis]MCM8558195.1 type II secretion system protein M [Sphingomicrobium sediminis]
MEGLRNWYLALSRREQVMVLAMLAIAAPVLLWLAVIRPVNAWHDSARDEFVVASERYGNVRALALALEQGEDDAPVAAFAGTVSDYVSVSAAQAGFALTRNVEAGPDRTDIGIAQAQAQAALTWIDQLRASGLRIESVRLTDNGEGGVAVDLIVARGRQ